MTHSTRSRIGAAASGRRVRATALLLAGLLAASSTLAACGDDDNGGGSSDGSLDELDLTFTISSTSLAHQLAYAADDGGFFGKYGISPRFVTAESSSVAVAAAASGSADVAFVGRVDGLLATAAGQQMVYIYKHSTGFLTNVTVSTEFAEQHPGYETMPVADRLRALDGVTFGHASPNGVLTRVLDSALAEVGATVEKTFLSVSTMPTALARGNVDGYMAPSPFQETSVQQGDGVMFIEGTELSASGGANIVQGATVVTQGFLDSNREAVVRVIAALTATAEAMQADPDLAKQLARERLTDTEDEIFDAMWPAAYEDITGPLEHPISPEDIQFMIEHDAADVPEAQSLDPAAQIVPADLVDEAADLVDQIGTT